LRRECLRVLDLHPALGAAGRISEIPPLAYDAFGAELAGVLEDLGSPRGRPLAQPKLFEGDKVSLHGHAQRRRHMSVLQSRYLIREARDEASPDNRAAMP